MHFTNANTVQLTILITYKFKSYGNRKANKEEEI